VVERTFPAWVAAVADSIVVVLFVAIGRRTHHSGTDVTGFLRVLWPFAAGLAAGWLVSGSWTAPLAWGRAVAVWLVTVGVGVALRVGVGGHAFRVSFAVVAFVFVGACMLGWRGGVAAARVRRARRDAGSRGSVRQR